MADNLAKKSFWSTFWTLMDTVFTKVTTLIVGIVLARLLDPSDFGLIGMMTVFIAISDVFIESGFGNAIIRKLDRTQSDLSTAFFFNIGVGIVAYCIIVSISPYVAIFYNEPQLEGLLRFVGFNVMLYSLCIVPNALLVSSFNLKKQAIADVFANIISGGVAIYLAYHGYGVMALIVQTLTLNAIKAICYWMAARWIPTLTVSKESVSYLWKFGSRALGIGLLGTLFANAYNIFIGKFYTKAELGYYTRADQFARVTPLTLDSVIQKVCIATFANLQDDKERLLAVYRKYVHVLCFLIFPLMFLIISISRPLILLVLTEKWENCVILMQILCFGFSFNSISTLNISLLNAINRVGYSLKLETYKKILFALIAIITFPIGLKAIAIGSAIYGILATCMNMSCSKRFINYKITSQLTDVLVYIVPSIISCCAALLICYFIDGNIQQILVASLVFIVFYLLAIFILRAKAVSYILELKRSIKK